MCLLCVRVYVYVCAPDLKQSTSHCENVRVSECVDLGVAHQLHNVLWCVYFMLYPPKNHMWCDANKWVHLILLPDCFHSHLLTYCFILTRKVAIKISNTHFPSQVCLPTPSIIWHPTTQIHTLPSKTHTYEKIKFMIARFGSFVFAWFLVVEGRLTTKNSWTMNATHKCEEIWTKLWICYGCKPFYCSMFNSIIIMNYTNSWIQK